MSESSDRTYKLPKWVQKEIDSSRRIIQTLQSENDQLRAQISGEIQTSISACIGISDKLYLDDNSTVTFWKNKDAYEGFHVSWAYYKNRTILRVSSTIGRIVIFPEASNSIHLGSELL